MKQKIPALLLAALLLLSVFPAASAAPRSEYAGVEILTETIFDRYSSAYIVGDYLFARAADNSVSLLSIDGNTVYLNGINEFVCITRTLWLVRFEGSERFALYRGATRLTNAIYSRGYEICGNCVALQKSGLPDIVDLNGNPLSVGRLPSGYVPYAVSSAGTVLARSQVNGMDYLFDRNGKALITTASGLRFFGSNALISSNAGYFSFYDLNGNRKFTLHPQHSTWIGDCFYAGTSIGPDTEFQEAAVEYKIYGPQLTQVGSITCTIIEMLNDEYFIFKDREGRFGLARKDGSIVVPGQFAHYDNGYADTDYRSNLYLLRNVANAPKAGRVAFSEPGKWYIYDLNGNLVLQTNNTIGVKLLEDCIAVSRKEGNTLVYDPYGTLLFELPQGQILESCCGVLFKVNSSGMHYLINRQGELLNPIAYTSVASTGAYGLASVCNYYNKYVIDANGGIVLEGPRKDYAAAVNFLRSEEELTGNLYSPFSLGDRKGICKYVPPDRPCAESATGQHRWQQTTVHTPATCTETGLMNLRCVECGAQSTEAIPIDPDNHAWSLTEILTEGEAGGSHGGTAIYTCSRCEETKEGRLCAGEVFTDMPADDYWAHTPIDWAYFNRITAGSTATTFAPKDKITRAEAMTFLWTLAGKPEPTLTESPFADVTEGKYYFKPVLWAVENHITSGKTETSFAPKDRCSRAEIMTFLWTAAGRPAPTLEENPFEDVPEDKYYYNPILWAFENGVTGGTSETTFSPKEVCSRAQVVTFLYKAKELLLP